MCGEPVFKQECLPSIYWSGPSHSSNGSETWVRELWVLIFTHFAVWMTTITAHRGTQARKRLVTTTTCAGITRTGQKQIHLNKKIWLTRSLLVGQFNNTKQDKRPTKSGVHNIGLNVARQRFQNGTQAIEYNSRLYSNNAAARRSCVVSELWATSVVTEWWTSRCSNTYCYFTIKTKFSDFASTKSCPKDRFFRILATYVGFWKYKKLFIVVIKKFVSTIWAIPLTWCCPQLDFKQKFGAHTHSSCAPQN